MIIFHNFLKEVWDQHETFRFISQFTYHFKINNTVRTTQEQILAVFTLSLHNIYVIINDQVFFLCNQCKISQKSFEIIISMWKFM